MTSTDGRQPAFWHVYVLECRDGSLYTGVTTDPDRRLEEHRRGIASRYTRSRLPVRLVHLEACADRSSALCREAAVKRLPRSAKLELVGRDRSWAAARR